jgi:hypothetical protein
MPEALLILTAILAFAYPLFMRWQLRRARTLRQRLVQMGQEMLSSPDYNPAKKVIIADMLGDALDWKVMARAVRLLPVVLWRCYAGHVPRNEANLRALATDPKFTQFLDLHWRSISAANPICAFIFRVELAITFVFLVSIIWTPYLTTVLLAKAAPPPSPRAVRA